MGLSVSRLQAIASSLSKTEQVLCQNEGSGLVELLEVVLVGQSYLDTVSLQSLFFLLTASLHSLPSILGG